jgi:kynureninase
VTIPAPLSAAADALCRYRDRFPILARSNYLISNSLGAVPAEVSASLQNYFNTWATRGVRAWEESWWTMVTDLGDLVAPLIGADSGEVAFQPNVTIAHAVVFSTVDFNAGRPRLVTDAMHFPSILYLIQEQAHLGAEVVMVPTDDGVTVDTQRLLEAIDERTALVNLSHVLFKSAYIHDIAAIAAKARRVGALTVIDGYQSVGTIAVDVKRLGLDVYIGGCLKWLCGGPGAAFLWVRPEVQAKLTPRLIGWMSHEQPFDFAAALQRKSGMWRFLHGTPNIAAFYAARPGLEIINAVGIPAIRAKSLRQTTRLLALADVHGLRCTTPRDPDRRGGTVAVDVEHGYEVSKALKARDIICDYRPGAGIRLSPHFYTRDDELDAAIGAIVEILENNSWKAFTSRTSAVT